MKNKTIESRATVIANKIYSGWETERIRQIERGAIIAATEQDKIARQEERERCIRLAQKHICDTFCKALAFVLESNVNCDGCRVKDRIRKAMEAEE